MSRYIDADAFIRNLQERYCKPCKANGLDYNGVKCKACPLDDEMDDIGGFADNSIDIEPKRGEWIDKGDRYWYCSECGTKDTDTWEWCHGCGADMRKESE